MKKVNEFITDTKNPEDTQKIAGIVGENIPEGTIITLYGDLGSGKTTFVQGLAKGLAVPDEYYITSPTYSIINEYPGKLPFYHMDLYRVSDFDELYEIGFEEILEQNGVIAIEWPERLPDDFFESYIKIDIKILENDERKLSVITYGLNLPDLIQKLSDLNIS
ncbi:MAG: tRNA (adenosine(37)-N6)-threonylcarbamoyltransferase complex ATPase subunit type 1 TsaE [Desulfobacterales bacterium]|nr:tRNA (adenosine(37)-N6)-threonylcarbamoyltransferase complex ATPase subunit type 1 TsaE [Desulfobacterales bacterium]MCP4163054.1 tRNA (adenosine(37)-N6)-threonylcarbamoyltransferase complex ATPase subunit type 1 TsaE [Deltaproteobacteria bacterium]